jgi:hypothetical protein
LSGDPNYLHGFQIDRDKQSLCVQLKVQLDVLFTASLVAHCSCLKPGTSFRHPAHTIQSGIGARPTQIRQAPIDSRASSKPRTFHGREEAFFHPPHSRRAVSRPRSQPSNSEGVTSCVRPYRNPMQPPSRGTFPGLENRQRRRTSLSEMRRISSSQSL